jgi:hypothetical protein
MILISIQSFRGSRTKMPCYGLTMKGSEKPASILGGATIAEALQNTAIIAIN